MQDYYAAFLHQWQQTLRYEYTPPHMYAMMDWLATVEDYPTSLLMAFRGASKSSTMTTYLAAALCRDPNTTALVLSENPTVVQATMRELRDILTQHPLAVARFGTAKFPEWRYQSLRLPGSSRREANVRIKGVEKADTGGRADLAILDDTEVPSVVRSPALHDRLKNEIIVEIGNIAKRTMFIGTPHAPRDLSIYAGLEDRLPPEAMLKIPYQPDDPVHQRWITPRRWAELKASQPANIIRSQYFLEYTSVRPGDLDPEMLIRYESGVYVFTSRHAPVTFIGDIQMQRVAAFWDPATGTREDNSVLAIVYMGTDDHYYIEELAILPPIDANMHHPFTPQYEVVAKLCAKHHLNSVVVEQFGYDMVFAGFNEYARDHKYNTVASPLKQTRKKETRISEALEPAFNSRSVHLREQESIPQLVRECVSFPHGVTDDCIDALASCVGILGAKVGSWIDLQPDEYAIGARPVRYDSI